MSTKTNFKRVALVAVAALGLGVLSSVPSQAVLSSATVTVTNGTDSTRSAYTDSVTVGTQATVNVRAFADAAYDSFTVTLASGVTAPAASGTVAFVMNYQDTVGATTGVAVTKDATPGTYAQARPALYDTVTAGTARVVLKGSTTAIDTAAANTYVAATFGVNIDNLETTDVVAGTYTGSVVVKFYDGGSLVTSKTVVKDFSIVVSALASASLVADAGKSTAVIAQGSTATDNSAYADSATVNAAATAGTQGAVIRVWLKNYAGNNAQESLTVSTDKGYLVSGGVTGTSFTVPYTTGTDLVAGYKDVAVYGSGVSGKATITIKSTSVTFAPKSVVFYATSVATIGKPTLLTTVIATGASSNNFLVVAKDSEGNQAGSGVTLYAYSSDTNVVSDGTTTGSACTFNATYGGHLCSVTGVIAGSATITVKNKSTAALSTVTSVASDAIKVSTNSAATVKLSFDKATYAPGEKATITVNLLDSAGNSVPANTFANTFAAGGITSTLAFGNGSDTLTNVSVTTTTDATVARFTPGKAYTVYMPAAGGTIKISATGGTSLPAAGQVAVSATATVTDNASAALAAVTALSTTVASLKTLIVTLTNLVLKIQKKVKA